MSSLRMLSFCLRGKQSMLGLFNNRAMLSSACHGRRLPQTLICRPLTAQFSTNSQRAPKESNKSNENLENNERAKAEHQEEESSPEIATQSTYQKAKQFIKKYGVLGTATYISISISTMTLLFLVISSFLDVDALYAYFGLSKPAAAVTEAAPTGEVVAHSENESETLEKLTRQLLNIITFGHEKDIDQSTVAIMVLVILINKFLLPVRLSLCLYITPRLHRALIARRGLNGN